MLDDELRVGVSKEFKKLLHKKAAELNLTLSAYIRLVLTKASKKDIFE